MSQGRLEGMRPELASFPRIRVFRLRGGAAMVSPGMVETAVSGEEYPQDGSRGAPAGGQWRSIWATDTRDVASGLPQVTSGHGVEVVGTPKIRSGAVSSWRPTPNRVTQIGGRPDDGLHS
jgi:hypothetical protein